MKKRLLSFLLLPTVLMLGFFRFPLPASALVSYTVIPGDSLFKIAQKYYTTVEQLKTQNGLSSDSIYAGQVLTIPDSGSVPGGQIHVVAQGESLFLIAQRYKTSVAELKRLNHLTGDFIYVGQKLMVGEVSTQPPVGQERPEAFIVAYYTEEEGNLPSSSWSTLAHMQSLTWVAPFWFRLNQYNAADIEKADKFTDTQVRQLVSTSHAKGVLVLPVIHNFLYSDKTLTKDLVTQMISTPESRATCINNIISLIRYYGFDGVNMDFEGVRVSDRDNLSVFYQELGDRLRARGYVFSVAVPAKSSDSMHITWSAPYDYRAIGQAADKVVLMMYNEHGYPGSGAGPVSSIGFNRGVIDYALTQMPSEKIILAEPVFGFDFNLETGRYSYLSHELAMQRVRDFKAIPVFDQASQTPYFTYTDPGTGQRHEVWYENFSSLKSKLDLIRQYRLAGVALWRLGMEDPSIWSAIREKVSIK